MSASENDKVTLEWFGATTFRLKANGVTIFLDAWLERPAPLQTYLKIEDVEECDYIFISHAHFDHLPGADRLAQRTGATIIANGEAISVMRAANIPEEQLLAVAGGERIPLFTKAQREEAIKEAQAHLPTPPPPPPSSNTRPPGAPPGPPGPPGPPLPDSSLAVITVHAWPSLHCLAPSADHRDIPEYIDTATRYEGSASHACTLDLTHGLTYGLGRLLKAPNLPPQMPAEMRAFITYMKDRDAHRYSFFDGGQIMYNFLLAPGKTVFWNGHLGGYEGIMKSLEPKPDVAILGIAGRANLDGRPFDGSAAEFAVREVQWLGGPEKVIWCLQDQGLINPKWIDTKAATEKVQNETRSQVFELEHGKVCDIAAL